MKKMIFMVMTMLSVTMTSHAGNASAESISDAESYDMTVNMRKLAVTLDMTSYQMETVDDIHRTFCTEMMLAAQAGKDEREELVDNAISKNLRHMSYVLDQNQYSKYQLLLNTTLHNRGLK